MVSIAAAEKRQRNFLFFRSSLNIIQAGLELNYCRSEYQTPHHSVQQKRIALHEIDEVGLTKNNDEVGLTKVTVRLKSKVHIKHRKNAKSLRPSSTGPIHSLESSDF